VKVKAVGVALALVLLPSAAFANVIFPGLILSDRLLAWWIIAATIFIEAGFLMLAFRLPPVNALFASLAANAASAVVGVLILPYAGLYTEIAVNKAGLTTDVGWAFSPQDWAVAFLLGLAINLVIELAVYRFGYGLKLGTRQVALITAANVITVGMAVLSIAFIPSHLY
jgi:hypothetical protein